MPSLLSRMLSSIRDAFGFGDEDIDYPAAAIDRDYQSNLPALLLAIPRTGVRVVDDFIAFAQVKIRTTESLATLGRVDRDAKLFRPFLQTLRTEVASRGSAGIVPDGQWLNPCGDAASDALHVARQEARRYIRRRFANEGWTPLKPLPREMAFATPKLNYLVLGLFLCQLLVRQRVVEPFADEPESFEYD